MQNIKYLFKGTKVDNQTREYIEKKLVGVVKILGEISKTEVEVGLDKKGKFRVEVMMHTARKMFRAEEISESIEGSIDIVVDELKAQARKQKDKVWTKLIRGARSIKKKITINKDARF